MTRVGRSDGSGHVKSDSVQHTEDRMSSADWGCRLIAAPHQLGKPRYCWRSPHPLSLKLCEDTYYRIQIPFLLCDVEMLSFRNNPLRVMLGCAQSGL